MKIGIITINDEKKPNYGNKLQNYAAEQIYNRLGCEYKTLATVSFEKNYVTYLKMLVNRLSGYRLSASQPIWKRRIVFQKFNKKYLHVSFDLLKARFDTDNYDYYSVGSDQVWNPTWYKWSCEGIEKKYLLAFAKPEQKICLSPSFGISALPEEWKNYFAEQLKTFPNLSVREEVGAKIIRELTGKDAEVLIDPTLMLTKEDWIKIAERPKYEVSQKYVLTYFLGEVSDETNAYINDVAKNHNLKIIRLEQLRTNEYWYATGPSEFVWLIAHCSLMCTDSFHGSVFSVLMNVPFLAFERKDAEAAMTSRMDTLLSVLQLEHRKFSKQKADAIFEKKYKHIDAILNNERGRVIKYLKRAMEMDA